MFGMSSHGYSGPARSSKTASDESDGKDEYIVWSNGQVIYDDEWLPNAFEPFLLANHRLIGWVDTCAAGTMLDMPYQYKVKQKQWIREWKTKRLIPSSYQVETNDAFVCGWPILFFVFVLVLMLWFGVVRRGCMQRKHQPFPFDRDSLLSHSKAYEEGSQPISFI